MPQIINTNIPSLTAQRNLNSSQNAQSTALQRLSSGLRINSSRDDAAGLAISTRFSTQVRGLSVAIRNAGDGVSLSQVTEGALGALTENLQRIRELALQSANGTNSADDRAAINEEVQQLKLEIARVSEQTNFNGTKLLDGSFTGITFQIGANEGEAVTIDIEGATPESLGSSITSGVSARGTRNPLANGDLILNGSTIPASKSSDDTASIEFQSSSAISKVAAINAASEDTGVRAEVLTNSVAGTTLTAASLTGSIYINGVEFGISVNTSFSAEANREAVVSSINAESIRTGVVAVNTHADSTGIVLEAADGRNITLIYDDVFSSAADGAGATGLPIGAIDNLPSLAADGLAAVTGVATQAGGYTLISTSSQIEIQQGAAGDLNANAGLVEGTYNSVGAFLNSLANAGTNALLSGDIVINNVPVPAANALNDSASSTGKNASAISKAAAINAVSEDTGVSATPNGNLVNGSAMTAAADTGTLTINGVATLSIATTTDAESSRLSVVNAINAITGQTGVTAVDTGTNASGVQLIADDGRNIVLAYSGSLDAAGTGLATAATYESSLQLNSAQAFTLDSQNANGLTNHGLTFGTFGAGSDGQFIKDIDVSTVEGALLALSAVDNALQTINIQRARLGAVQNRFESTVQNQAIAMENLAAANSRIKDADFAAETAALSRAQVLQQAGISILGQANAIPQQVLSLLQ